MRVRLNAGPRGVRILAFSKSAGLGAEASTRKCPPDIYALSGMT